MDVPALVSQNLIMRQPGQTQMPPNPDAPHRSEMTQCKGAYRGDKEKARCNTLQIEQFLLMRLTHNDAVVVNVP